MGLLHVFLPILAVVVVSPEEEEEVVDAAIQKLRRIGDFGPGLCLPHRRWAAVTGAEAGAAKGRTTSLTPGP